MTKTAKKRAEQKRRLVEILGGKCRACGYCKNAAALDFHHTDPKKKDAVIGYLINFHRFADAFEEAKKCILLCKRCHTEEHNKRLEIVVDNGKVTYKDAELKKIEKMCAVCGEYSGGQIYCSNRCKGEASRRVADRPSQTDLTEMLETMSFCAIGRKYGVTDNAVRKWAKAYGILGDLCAT